MWYHVGKHHLNDGDFFFKIDDDAFFSAVNFRGLHIYFFSSMRDCIARIKIHKDLVNIIIPMVDGILVTHSCIHGLIRMLCLIRVLAMEYLVVHCVQFIQYLRLMHFSTIRREQEVEECARIYWGQA